MSLSIRTDDNSRLLHFIHVKRWGKASVTILVTAVLMSIFLVDDIHSLKHPNEGAGVTDIEAPVRDSDSGLPTDQNVTESIAEPQPVT